MTMAVERMTAITGVLELLSKLNPSRLIQQHTILATLSFGLFTIYYVQPSSLSEVLDHHVGMPSRLPQWLISLTWNQKSLLLFTCSY